MATTAVLAARYMTRFRCLAGECEATCCGGGSVPVEESNHRRLTVLARDDEEALALLEQGVTRTPAGPAFGRIRFDDSGGCSLRDSAGLCKIHQRFGHDALFDVCATFPRYVSEIDDEVELFGTLACPEVARLALLADDAFELAHATLGERPRVLRNRFRTDQPYHRPFKLVRAALVRLISEPGYGLPHKLFVLLWLTDKLKGVLRRDADVVPQHELERTLAALAEPEILGSLTASFAGLSLDGNLAFSALVAALRPPREPRYGAQTQGFDELWDRVVERYGASLAPGATPTDAELRQVFSRYVAERERLPISTDARIDSCVSRYIVNHLLTTPHMLSSDAFEYAYDAIVRAAGLRFLLSTELSGEERSASEVDASIVRVTYGFVRTVEHSDALGVLRRALRSQGLDGLAHAVSFLAIWSRRP